MPACFRRDKDNGKRWNAAALTKLIDVLKFLPASKPKLSMQNK
jgi:hypothetical protein